MVSGYRLELRSPADDLVYTQVVRGGGDGTITHELPDELESDTTYRWRVRAELGGTTGPWSAYAEFVTMVVVVVEPGVELPPGPYPADGLQIAHIVAGHWPEYLAGPVTMEEREENMEFLRDRMIEIGLCAGLDVAWNLKRGIGPHSHDALAWRIDGNVEVVDIALAFKDPSKPMSLHWNITDGPSGYDPYTNPFTCR